MNSTDPIFAFSTDQKDTNVEKILGHRFSEDGKISYLVKLNQQRDPQWIEASSLNCVDAIMDYLSSLERHSEPDFNPTITID